MIAKKRLPVEAIRNFRYPDKFGATLNVQLEFMKYERMFDIKKANVFASTGFIASSSTNEITAVEWISVFITPTAAKIINGLFLSIIRGVLII